MRIWLWDYLSEIAAEDKTCYCQRLPYYHDNKLFLATASGMIAFTEKISGEEINLKAIESNFKQFFNYEEFKKVDDISVKDLLTIINLPVAGAKLTHRSLVFLQYKPTPICK